MANYRIKVEVLNDNMERSEQLESGIEVEGLVLLANVDNDNVMSCIMNMSRFDIASAIHGEEAIISGALLSKVLSKMEDNDNE